MRVHHDTSCLNTSQVSLKNKRILLCDHSKIAAPRNQHWDIIVIYWCWFTIYIQIWALITWSSWMISKVSPHFLVANACSTAAISLTRKLTQNPFPLMLLLFPPCFPSYSSCSHTFSIASPTAAVRFPRDFLSPSICSAIFL